MDDQATPAVEGTEPEEMDENGMPKPKPEGDMPEGEMPEGGDKEAM